VDYDGNVKWRFRATRFWVAADKFYATPALAYHTAYIGSIGNTIYAIDLVTGHQRWATHTGGWVYSSPAVWRDLVFEGSYDRTFYALDAASGKVRWRFRVDSPVSGSPTVIDGVVYFSSLDRHTWGLDCRTGTVLWQFADGRYTAVTAGLNTLYLCGSQTLYALVEKR
jgi:outer membrane protein assembly factor BamB